MKNATICLGVKKFTSKDGRNFCILETSAPFSDREIANGCKGSRVEEIFLPEHLHNKADTLTVGGQIAFDYTVVSGRAYVDDVYDVKAK
jgi:hypothetical protein